MTETGIPSLQDELDRKAIETAQSIQHRFNQGQLTKAQYDAATNALWYVTAGLVDNDVSAAITAMGETAAPEQWTHCPMAKGADLTVVSFSTAGKFRFLRGDREECRDFADPVEDVSVPSLAAKQHFGKVFKLLSDRGYVRV